MSPTKRISTSTQTSKGPAPTAVSTWTKHGVVHIALVQPIGSTRRYKEPHADVLTACQGYLGGLPVRELGHGGMTTCIPCMNTRFEQEVREMEADGRIKTISTLDEEELNDFLSDNGCLDESAMYGGLP